MRESTLFSISQELYALGPRWTWYNLGARITVIFEFSTLKAARHLSRRVLGCQLFVWCFLGAWKSSIRLGSRTGCQLSRELPIAEVRVGCRLGVWCGRWRLRG